MIVQRLAGGDRPPVVETFTACQTLCRGSAPTEEPEVSILIVGYNSASYLAECIGSIEGALSRHSYEVLFVNKGADHSERLVSDHFPGVHILPAIGNVGFATANIKSR